MSKVEVFTSSIWGRPARNDQCDCACATSDHVVALSNNNLQGVFRQSTVHQFDISPSYKLLFNQLVGQEVVVVNEAAYDLWGRFNTPTLLNSLPGEYFELAQQLYRLALLEPVAKPYHPCKSTPDTLNVWLHVTNNCNLLCNYCYINKSNEQMSMETGMAAIEAAFRSAQAGGFKKVTFKFAGGEPTLCLDTVFQLHSYGQEVAARENIELDAVVLSNGVTLHQESMDEIQTRGLRLMLSIDGIGLTHDVQRPFRGGQGSYEKVWRALEQAINSGLKPFISITVTAESANGLPDLVNQLLPLELPFNLNFARSVMPSKRSDNQRMIAGLLETFKCIESNLPQYSLMGSVLDRSFFSSAHDRPCGVGESYLVIDHRGQVASCQMNLHKNVTNIHIEDPLLVLKMHSSAQNPSVDEKDGCSQCQWKYMCAGGCPLTAYHATGRYDVASPFCDVFKILYPELLRLEGLRILKYSGASEEMV